MQRLQAGLIRGLMLAMQTTVAGVLAAFIIRGLSTRQEIYIDRISLVSYVLVAVVILLFYRLMISERPTHPTHDLSRVGRVILFVGIISSALFLSITLFVGYSAGVWFAPDFADVDTLPTMYETLLARVLAFPFMAVVGLGIGVAAALGWWGFERGEG